MICSAHAAERQSRRTKRKLHRKRRKTLNCWRMTRRSPALCARSHRKLFRMPEERPEQVVPMEQEWRPEQVLTTAGGLQREQRDPLTGSDLRTLPITAPEQTVLPTARGLQLQAQPPMQECPDPIRASGARAAANRAEIPCTEIPMWIRRSRNPGDAAKPIRAAISCLPPQQSWCWCWDSSFSCLSNPLTRMRRRRKIPLPMRMTAKRKKI